MYKYIGSMDPTRALSTDWEERDYAAALKHITDAEFTGWKPSVASYDPKKNPAPTVSTTSLFPVGVLFQSGLICFFHSEFYSSRALFALPVGIFPIGLFLFILFLSSPQLYTVLKGSLPPKDPVSEAQVTEDDVESEEEEEEAADEAVVQEEERVEDPLPQPIISAPKTRLQKRKAGEIQESPSGKEDGDYDEETTPSSNKVAKG